MIANYSIQPEQWLNDFCTNLCKFPAMMSRMIDHKHTFKNFTFKIQNQSKCIFLR